MRIGGGLLITVFYLSSLLCGQAPASLTVDFSRPLQAWDGFGINYVETAQTRDYKNRPQEYGGLQSLSAEKRNQVLDLIWGDDGLKPGVLKMFLDPWHQTAPGAVYDHESSTKWMRLFAREGLRQTKARGESLEVITTLYGPPAYMTRQKFIRGRDLDPAHKRDLGLYLIDWVKFLREKEALPVKYLSLHNEGEDFNRWPTDGRGAGELTHDYNMFWPPSQIVEMVKYLRPMLDQAGLKDVGVTPGECSNWDRFVFWGHATELERDPAALRSLGLITSHGFTGGTDYWFGTHNSRGVDLLRLQRPELHAWTTSMTWGKMDVGFVDDLRGQVYTVKVNSAIPWAAVQTSNWVGGDPNPGTAIRVIEECGCYQVMPGYWLYKQVSRAGQPGMRVATVSSSDNSLRLMAFASNGSKSPDAFVLINMSTEQKSAAIAVKGSAAATFSAYRTDLLRGEHYKALPAVTPSGGVIQHQVPGKSVTTFFAK